jgi:glycine/D-amino acid oxidase-like deaminating enzyme
LNTVKLKIAAGMSITRPNIVIVGAGIHGAATAFYLSKMGWNSIIIESSEVASAASGKSGGFLAKNWGSEFTKQLHEVSFEMHNALAEELQIESYRRITTLEVNCQRKGKNIASWLDRKVSSQIMDTETAQVTPKELTIKLLNQAIQNGSQLIIDTVQGIKIQNNKVRGVQLHHNQFIEAERVMLCMGPWSGVACEDWFNLPIPLTGIKSTSIVYRDLEEIKSEPYACFCTEDSNDCHLEL